MRQLIDSTQIDQWFVSASRDAQEVLPHLMRLLITATVDIASLSALRIPVGNEINRPGFDGVVEVTSGNRYVPSGISVWEMGTSDPAAKAEEDYRKRSKNSRDLDFHKTTFVFVTPHPWAQKDVWVKSKVQEGRWKDVLAFDNIDITAWLELAPAVSRWLARQMGLPIEGLVDVELFKGELDAIYGFAIPPALLIGGRLDASGALANFFENGPAAIEIEGESVEEAAGFIAATILSLPSEKREWASSRTLFAQTPEVLDFVSLSPSVQFVVPLTTEARRRARALPSRGMHLLIPTVRTAGTPAGGEGKIRLGSIKRAACQDALIGSGANERRAQRIARECKGSLTAALWMAARGPDTALPWTDGQAAVELVPLLLAGQWLANSQTDQSIVEYLAGRKWDEVERTLITWRAPAGPLVRRSALWDWVAVDYAWKCMAALLDPVLLSRFRCAVLKVFGIPEPKLELPSDQRWAAAIYGKEHPYSADLRSGLIASLAQLAVNDDLVQGGGQAFVSSIVTSLLNGEVLSRKDAWQSVAQWLPDMAEAAPDAFFLATESLIADSDALGGLFTEVGVFGSSLHAYLLWALERLAWSETQFTRCVLILGDLASVDPGGRVSNRPNNSLSEIFLPWHPQGTAGIPHRLDAIDLLYQRQPDVAWNLVAALLPGESGFAMSIADPQWHDWKPNAKPRVTNSEYWSFIEHIVQRALSWAGTSGERWKTLIESYPRLLHDNPDLADSIRKAMHELRPGDFAARDRQQITEVLRTLITHHREFQDQEWAMRTNGVQPLEEIHQKFVSQDARERHKWLFASWPRLPEERNLDYKELGKLVEQRRERAIQEVFVSYGTDGVLQFGEGVESPETVGYAFSQISHDSAVEAEVLGRTLSITASRDGVPPLLRLGLSYVGGRFRKEGPDWVKRVRQLDGMGWDANKLTNLAWGLPQNGQTWDWIETWSNEAARSYWRQVPLAVLEEPERDTVRAIRNLLEVGRPFRAIFLASMSLHHLKDKAFAMPMFQEVIIKALEEAPKQSRDQEWYPPDLTSVAHRVEELLNALEKQGISDSILAGIEWTWMPALEHGTRGLKVLQKQLSSDPELFIRALTLAFRAEDEEPKELSGNEKRMGRQAYRLLEGWKRMPGRQEQHQPKEKIEGDIVFDVGRVDQGELFSWIGRARELARECKRLGVCDSRIGNMLAYSPADADGAWPGEAVRNLIEDVKSEDLERAIQIGVYNKRGGFRRETGGEQERRLAEKFRGYAKQVHTRWVRTASLLERMAQHYEREAKQEDERSAFEEFE